MSFTLRYDEEHALLRDEARRWLAERVTPAELRRLAETRAATSRRAGRSSPRSAGRGS